MTALEVEEEEMTASEEEEGEEMTASEEEEGEMFFEVEGVMGSMGEGEIISEVEEIFTEVIWEVLEVEATMTLVVLQGFLEEAEDPFKVKV